MQNHKPDLKMDYNPSHSTGVRIIAAKPINLAHTHDKQSSRARGHCVFEIPRFLFFSSTFLLSALGLPFFCYAFMPPQRCNASSYIRVVAVSFGASRQIWRLLDARTPHHAIISAAEFECVSVCGGGSLRGECVATLNNLFNYVRF